MLAIGVLLIIVSVFSLAFSLIGIGDIGISFFISGIVALLSGIGFIIASTRLKK